MRKIAFILTLLPFQLFAQFEIGMLTTSSQQMVEGAVKSGMFLSKQSFQICDRETGGLFGLNGKDEFGIHYSIGVKVADGFILTDPAVRPWLYNDKFGKYKEKYDPIFHQAAYSELEGKIAFDSLAYTLSKQEELVDTLVYRFTSEAFMNKGFVLDETAGKKDGWVVWVYTDKNVDWEKEIKLSYTIYKKEVSIADEEISFEIDQPDARRKVLGGIYVVPVNTHIGVIEFRLGGIIALQEGAWKVVCPFARKETSAPEGTLSEDASAEEAPVLTPVGNTDKKKAQEEKKDKKKKRK